MQTDQISMKHEYSDSEFAALSHDIANALHRKKNLDDELNSVKKDFQAQIAAQESLISSLSTRISSGFEMQLVKVLLLDERLEGYRLSVRTDTGHIYRRRKLEQAERQLTIADAPPKQYHCAVMMHVDDDQWKVDIALVPLFEDEWDALRELPDVTLQQMFNVPAPLAIEASADDPPAPAPKGKGKK